MRSLVVVVDATEDLAPIGLPYSEGNRPVKIYGHGNVRYLTIESIVLFPGDKKNSEPSGVSKNSFFGHGYTEIDVG